MAKLKETTVRDKISITDSSDNVETEITASAGVLYVSPSGGTPMHHVITDNFDNNNLYITVSNTTGDTLSAGELCYISGDDSGVPEVTKTIASDESGCSKMLVMIDETINNGSNGNAIIFGLSDDFSGKTAGAIQYISDTVSGGITEVAPSDSGDIVRVIGYAMTTTEVFFDPDKTWVEI